MKRISILVFLFRIGTGILPAQSISCEIIDDENLLSQPLLIQLQDTAAGALSFITPFTPVSAAVPAEDGTVYAIRITVAGKGASREADPVTIIYSFICEIAPGTASPEASNPGTPERFSFTCAGAGTNFEEASRGFIENFKDQLIFELMLQPALRNDICVLYLFGRDAVLSLPREKKLRIGAEYDMNLPGDEGKPEFAGRLVVTSLESSYALGRMLYEVKPLKPGAVGTPSETSGLETRIHAGLLLKEGQNAFTLRLTEGLRLPIPWLIPVVGVHVPFFLDPPSAGTVPVTFLLGARVPWFMGKMQLFSTLSGGIGAIIGQPYFYAGMLAEIGFEFRISRYVSLLLSGGYTGWTPAGEGSPFSGFFAGIGAGFFY